MNETVKVLLNRRSIRAYKKEQIKDEHLETILEVGKFAPSGMNAQPWHFNVIQNKDLLKKINNFVKDWVLKSDAMNQGMKDRAKSDSFSTFYDAPTLVIVSGNNSIPTAKYDCTLALGNMFNAAASLGVGSCWVHAIGVALNTEAGKELIEELYIPEGYAVFCSGSFGYSDGETPAPLPRKENTIKFIK